MKTTIASREDWLLAAIAEYRPRFAAKGYELPEKIRVACGWPGGRRVKNATGQCWSTRNSKDGTWEIFISPVLDEHTVVLGTLVHELVHVVVGIKAGHKRPFGKCAEAMGLVGPWKSSGESEAFKLEVPGIVAKIGSDYPHAAMTPGHENSSGPPKQGTRLVKCQCKACGYTVRTTMKWILTSGAPLCPTEGCDQEPMEVEV